MPDSDAHGVDEERARPPGADAVLDRHDQPVAGGVGEHGRVGRRHDPDVPDGGVDPVGGQLVRGLLGRLHHLAHGQEADRAVAPVDQAGREPVPDRAGGRPGGPASSGTG